jgi:transposase
MRQRAVRTQRQYSERERKQILAEATAPSASVTEVARRHEMNHNVIFHWLRKRRAPAMLPVEMIASAADSSATSVDDACDLIVCIGVDTKVQFRSASIEMVRAVLSALRS